MATITVDPNTSLQTFVGWQATCQAAQEWNATSETNQYPSTTFANYDAEIIAAALDLGINSLRVEIKCADVNATAYDPDGNNAAVQPSTASAGHWRYERLTRQMDNIAMPLKTALQSQGEDLHITLCIVDKRNTGYEMAADVDEYSLFVNNFVQKMWDDYSVLPDVIEAILEPNEAADVTHWTASRIANCIVQANTDLVSNGHTGITWAAPSTSQADETTAYYSAMKSANGSVTALLSEIYYHRYDSPSTATVDAIADAAEADGKTAAMSEYIGATHATIYDDLIFGRNSTWQQFTLTFPYTGVSNTGEQYFQVNTSTWAVTMWDITKYLRSYMRYVRRGAVRKGVTNESANYQGVPFQNANGKYVVPIKCTASGTIAVVGLPAGTYEIRYTAGNGTSAPSAYDTSLGQQTVNGSQDVTFSMPAAGVVTVFDVDYMTQPGTGDKWYAIAIT